MSKKLEELMDKREDLEMAMDEKEAAIEKAIEEMGEIEERFMAVEREIELLIAVDNVKQ
jgi:hypothetical protein